MDDTFEVNVTEGAKTKRPMARYYVDVETCVITQRLDGVDTVLNFDKVDDKVWARLALDGYIYHRCHGKSHDEVVTGQAFADRSMPTGSTKQEREPGVWVRAIAAVKSAQLAAAKKATGIKTSKPDIEAMDAEALAWAKSLTTEQAKKLRSSVDVQVAHASIVGKKATFDELLAA